MQVIVDGLLTTYDRSGKGKVIVMLHGWGDRAAGFAGLRSVLAHDYQVIAPDLPGFGGTQSPLAVWGLSDYAMFISNFLAKLDIRSVYAFVGHSNGGAIVLRGIGQGTLHSDKVILMASSGIRGDYNGRRRLLRYIAKAGKTLTQPLPEKTKTALRRRVYASIGSDMFVAEHLQETFKRVVTDDVRTDASAVAVPTLLLYGERDEATPIRYGELFHQLISGSILKVLPEAGHFIHLDDADRVASAVKDFLA
jgi:pimeloyl-ACP methyl ester carboxylesterase